MDDLSRPRRPQTPGVREVRQVAHVSLCPTISGLRYDLVVAVLPLARVSGHTLLDDCLQCSRVVIAELGKIVDEVRVLVVVPQ